MSLAVVHSRALIGLAAPAVQVEVHLANGLPSFSLVGLADTEVREARDRVRAALAQCGFSFPHNRRITVNLAPADLPKDSGRFDLPIALGVLAAQGLLDTARLARHEFAGELSLAGELRPVRGALALALGARGDAARRHLVLPAASAAEAARVPGLTVFGLAHLSDVVQALLPQTPVSADGSAEEFGGPASWHASVPTAAATQDLQGPDLAEVRGQAAAKRALLVAAVGQHGLLMSGPPGAGKTMLAQRLPGLLPPLEDPEALESAALWSISTPGFDATRYGMRPFRSPHHSASAVALVGGGSPPKPGEISLAHAGVLFLDELPEFPRTALEALREPLENGWVTIARAGHQARYPARFQLVAAMNPCPCGWLGAGPAARQSCRCTPERVARYQARLSGPLLDRIDLQVEVPAQAPTALLDQPAGDSSANLRALVVSARATQLARQGCVNAWLAGQALEQACPLEPAARTLLLRAAERMGWSGRSLHRVIRVARSLADLEHRADIAAAHVAEAVQYRRVLPSP